MSEDANSVIERTLEKGLFDMDLDELGEVIADEQRRVYSTIISKHTSMTFEEAEQKFLDREADAIEATDTDESEWAVRLAAQDLIVESIIERVYNKSQ